MTGEEVAVAYTRRLRSNFAWSISGNLVYNISRWLLIVVLARMGTAEMVGEYALAQAISAPIFLTVGLNLRVVRATDVDRVWHRLQYRNLRIVLNVLSTVLAVPIGVLFGLDKAGIVVLLMVCIGKASEASSQVLYGFFQLHDRLDLVSRSLLTRAALGTVAFIFSLSLTGDLAGACLGLALGWFVCYLVHDLPAERRLVQDEPKDSPKQERFSTFRLARKAVPLGVSAGLGSLALNVPRYGVQIALGTTQLGVFAALAYSARIVSVTTGALANSVISRLAHLARARDVRRFVRLLGILLVFGMGISTVAGVAAWAVGGPVVRALMGDQYVNQPVLILLMIGAGLTTVQRSFSRGLQAGHRYKGAMWVMVVTTLGCIAASVALIPLWGLNGAAITVGAGFAIGAALAGYLLWRMLKSFKAGAGDEVESEGPA